MISVTLKYTPVIPRMRLIATELIPTILWKSEKRCARFSPAQPKEIFPKSAAEPEARQPELAEQNREYAGDHHSDLAGETCNAG